MITVYSYEFVGFCHWLVDNNLVEKSFSTLSPQEQANLVSKYQHGATFRRDLDNVDIDPNWLQHVNARRNGQLPCGFQGLVDRYIGVGTHCLFVHTSEDDVLEAYVRDHIVAMDGMSDNYCDIYVSKQQQQGHENAYTQRRTLQTLPDFEPFSPQQLPLLHIWSRDIGVTVSLAECKEYAQYRDRFREIFTVLQSEPGPLNQHKVDRIKRTSSTKLGGGVFISYRRQDSQDVVGRIYDKLIVKYGADNVIRDIDSLTIGRPFPEALDEAVTASAIILVIIGKHWASICNEHGAQRLSDNNDFVRREVIRALESHKRVVPILVAGADMPVKSDIPEILHPLLDQHGSLIRSDPDFHHDMDRLMRQIDIAVECSSQ
jgi:hypothetical protein